MPITISMTLRYVVKIIILNNFTLYILPSLNLSFRYIQKKLKLILIFTSLWCKRPHLYITPPKLNSLMIIILNVNRKDKSMGRNLVKTNILALAWLNFYFVQFCKYIVNSTIVYVYVLPNVLFCITLELRACVIITRLHVYIYRYIHILYILLVITYILHIYI